MLSTIVGLMATASVLVTTPTLLVTERVIEPKAELTSTSSIKSFIEAEARKAGVDEKLAVRLVKCESGFVPQQSQIVKNGVREDSWGVWQIHLPSHPQVTREKAMDIEFSTGYSLDLIKKGKASLWSCY